MSKLTFAIVLLTVFLSASYADRPIEYTGYDWFKWSVEQQRFYTLGFISGTWSSVQVLLNRKALSFLDYEDWRETASPYGISSYRLVDEVTAFYQTTDRLDYPIPIVILMRRMTIWKYKKLPPWSAVGKEWE